MTDNKFVCQIKGCNKKAFLCWSHAAERGFELGKNEGCVAGKLEGQKEELEELNSYLGAQDCCECATCDIHITIQNIRDVIEKRLLELSEVKEK